LKSIKKEYEDYKHSIIERMEVSTHKEMENLNKQIADYESKVVFQNHNFDFRLKDKKANQIFERRVIY
jgi:predicted DNA binding CopG/RHH family protein